MTGLRLDRRGFVELRNDPGVVAMCQSVAEYIADVAGDGVATRPPETDYSFPRGRCRAAVVTETAHAMNREKKHNTLEHVVQSLGGG